MSAQGLLSVAAGIALTAVVVGILVLREAWLDYRHVQELGLTNGRLILARREFKTEVARTVALMFYLVAAVSSAMGAESVGPLSLPRAFGISAFGFGHLVLAVDSIRVLILRYRQD